MALLPIITATAVLLTVLVACRAADYSKCGLSHDANNGFRIVDGKTATPNQFPWMVAVFGIFGTDSKGCGGSIIDSKHILTAAHCVHHASPINNVVYGTLPASMVTVFTGTTDLDKFDKNTLKDVERVFVHEKYDSYEKRNDLAVLRLTEALKFDRHQSPVCLTDDDVITVGRKCTVMGWGASDKSSNERQRYLQYREDPMQNPTICKAMFHKFWEEGAICGMTGALCHADNGGPYVCKDTSSDTYYYQYGIVAGGPCETSGKYTSVPHHLTWIKKQIATQ